MNTEIPAIPLQSLPPGVRVVDSTWEAQRLMQRKWPVGDPTLSAAGNVQVVYWPDPPEWTVQAYLQFPRNARLWRTLRFGVSRGRKGQAVWPNYNTALTALGRVYNHWQATQKEDA